MPHVQNPAAFADMWKQNGLPHLVEKDGAGTLVAPSGMYHLVGGLWLPVSEDDPMPVEGAVTVQFPATQNVALTGSTVTLDTALKNVEGTPGQAPPSKAVLVGGSDGVALRALYIPNNLGTTGGDSWGMAVPGIIVKNGNLKYNGAGWDYVRNNTEGALLASAARTATTTSPDQTNYNAQGVTITLDVTANPGGADSLTLAIQVKDPVSGKYKTIATTGALPAAVNNTYVLQVLPGAVETVGLTDLFVQGVGVPRTWRAIVSHSSSGPSWTYSLGYQYSV